MAPPARCPSGLTNGDLFTHVLAFSPGFMSTDGRRGRPRICLAHGSADPVLPVSFSRNLAGELRDGGYVIVYEELAETGARRIFQSRIVLS
jgi:predicted esterase